MRAAVLLVGLVVLVGSAGTASTPSARAQTETPPNVLIILTDDQRRLNLSEVMPSTARIFERGGTDFTRAFATTPLCCPSRASIFSGRYAHNHGVENNKEAGAFDERSGIQRYLQERGYRTALFGKYLLGRPLGDNPAYFDRWATFLRSPQSYEDGMWNVDGNVEQVPGYSTTYIAERALGFIDEQETVDIQPWMMMLSAAAPHAPFIAEDRYRGAAVPKWDPNRAVGERDVSDKPPIDRIGEATRRDGARLRRRQVRTLYSVDDLVARVFAALDDAGEQNTLAFFVSDNGYLWGEHGLTGKRYAYLPSVQVPLLVRWPGRVDTGARDRHLAATIDIAPTIMDAAGVTPDPEYPVDGHSLLGDRSRRRLLLEFEREGKLWSWASTITSRNQYVEYYADSGARLHYEYYDLRRDPAQLRNLFGDGRRDNNPDRRSLKERLARDRTCAGADCP